MKELSIEEKAKRYDEAKARMSKAYNDNRCTIGFMNEIFPELVESENEKVKKSLIRLVKAFYDVNFPTPEGFTKEQLLSWIEEQGEQKSTLRIDNSRSKVVFPFKAKLKSTGIVVTIYSGQLSVDGKEWIKYQSDKEDGYKVYEPNDLEPVCNVEQNTAWSEEDEDILNTIINHFKIDIECTDEDDVIRWLKSLKGRYTWKPSKEQMEALEEVYDLYCDVYNFTPPKALIDLYTDLKDLMN